MATISKCDLCGREAEGYFPGGWMNFSIRKTGTAACFGNDICERCKSKLPTKLTRRIETMQRAQ